MKKTSNLPPLHHSFLLLLSSFFIFPSFFPLSFIFPSSLLLSSFSSFFSAIRGLAGTREDVIQQVEQIGEALVRLGPADLKAGKLKPVVSAIQQIQCTTEPDWSGRILLTKLLLSIANITRVIQRFELVSVAPDALAPMPAELGGRRGSLSSTLSGSSDPGQSPRELDSSLITPAGSQIDYENTEDEKNIFVETDITGCTQYISPSAQEILRYSFSFFWFFLCKPGDGL